MIQSMIAMYSSYETRFALFVLSGSGGQALAGLLLSLTPVLFLEQATTAVLVTTVGAAVMIAA